MGTDVFLLTKPAGSNSIQRACSQASLEYDLATGLSTEMFFDNDNLPVFLGYFPCLTSRTEHTSASED
jgi:hypothetical protein